jgi:hypothetical protein
MSTIMSEKMSDRLDTLSPLESKLSSSNPDQLTNPQATIPMLTSETMTKQITDRLGSIEEAIRHKNDVIDKLKKIQDDVVFILSETDKLTASNEPLTLEGLNNLTVIYTLVENIFNLMDKTSSENINRDIGDMMKNLSSIRSKIVGVTASIEKENEKKDATTESTGAASTKPSNNPTTANTATTATTPSTTTTPSTSVNLNSQNIEQLSGKTIKTSNGQKEIQLDDKIIQFCKNFTNSTRPPGYEGKPASGDYYLDTYPPELSSLLKPGKIGGLDVTATDITVGKNKFKLRLLPYELKDTGTIYYIFNKHTGPLNQPGDYKKVQSTSLVFYIDNGNLKYFFFKPNGTDINLFVPKDDKYIKINKINQEDSSSTGSELQLSNMTGQIGGKTRKYKKNKKKTLRFL